MQQGDVLGEGVDVGYGMYERVLHVFAKLSARFGDKWDAPAAHGFSTNQPETLLDAGENKDVALAHELGNIIAIAKDTNAGVSELCGELVPVCGEKFPGDQKGAVAMSRGTQPGIQRKVQSFSNSTYPDEQHRQPGRWFFRAGGGVIYGFVVTVNVTGQLRGREALIDEGARSKF